MKSLINTATVLLKKRSSKTDKSLEFRVDVSMMSDIGCHRTQNQDSILYVKFGEKETCLNRGMIAIVADGMGGHQSGEIASSMAVECISKGFYEKENAPLAALEQAFMDANKKIFTDASERPELKGMGTTCTTLVIRNGQAFFAHVGDSRLYRLRNRKIEQLTYDHTLVNEMVRNNLITPAQAEDHPSKNIVTRAMGTHREVEVDVQGPLSVYCDDYYVLCSDGLYEGIKGDELKETVLSATPHKACKQLIFLARKRGGYDNISIGIIAIKPVQKGINTTRRTTRFE